MALEGKTAIVTGAGRGIGRAIGLRLAADGADIAVNDIVREQADSVAGEIRRTGRRAIAIQADVTDKAAVEAMVERTTTELGKLDITVNAYCPGIVGTDMWDLIDEQLGGYLGQEKGETLQEYAKQAPSGECRSRRTSQDSFPTSPEVDRTS